METGIDVLERQAFACLQDKRVGLVTNPTGQTRDGRSTADVLLRAPGVTLAALFSPEHGLRARLDEDGIPDGTDDATGLPVYSLYGERRAPSAAQLSNLDALVVDIQDVGTRFYTYISTLALCLHAAAENGTPIVVLDRPNPITGTRTEGPLTDTDKASFVAPAGLPLRHGLTVGEFARLYVQNNKLDVDLAVIACVGWHPADWFDRTGLLWTPPSPNMRTVSAAALYAGVGLLEMTPVSVGRGTDTPFEVFGAPFIHGQELARYVHDKETPGVRCVPVRFTPTANKYAGEPCGGVQFIVVERERLNAVQLGLTLACALRDLYPNSWDNTQLQTLLAHDATYQLLLSGADYDTMASAWAAELQEFNARREAILLYA